MRNDIIRRVRQWPARVQLIVPGLLVVLTSCMGMDEARKQVAVPMGTAFVVKLSEPLSTATNETGETFLANTERDLCIGDTLAIPAGAKVRGMLTVVERPGRASGRAKMTLVFNGVMLDDGTWYSIASRPVSLEATSQAESDVENVAAGGKKGAAIGGVLGAGAGRAVALATKGDDITLPKNQPFKVELKGPVSLPIASIQ